MTVGVSTVNTANAWLNATRTSGSTLTAPTACYVQLHTADPGASGTTAVSVGSTTRNSVTHNAASDRCGAAFDATDGTVGGKPAALIELGG